MDNKKMMPKRTNSDICSLRHFFLKYAFFSSKEKALLLETAIMFSSAFFRNSASEIALLYFLKGEEKNKVAKEALAPIAWIVVHHLSALFETENNSAYLSKASQILDILFDDENEEAFLESLRGKVMI